MDVLFRGVTITRDPELIASWVAEVYRLRLYRDDGVFRIFARGETDQKIYAMGYIPKIAWIAYHDCLFGLHGGRWSAYTREDMRCCGILHRFWDMALEQCPDLR